MLIEGRIPTIPRQPIEFYTKSTEIHRKSIGFEDLRRDPFEILIFFLEDRVFRMEILRELIEFIHRSKSLILGGLLECHRVSLGDHGILVAIH